MLYLSGETVSLVCSICKPLHEDRLAEKIATISDGKESVSSTVNVGIWWLWEKGKFNGIGEFIIRILMVAIRRAEPAKDRRLATVPRPRS